MFKDMTEEVFIRKDADALDLLIADRLGERQRKLDRMATWERPARSVQLRPVMAALAIAACLAVAFVVIAPWKTTISPWDELGLESPSSETLRAATPDMAEITQLIEAQNYDEAIVKTEQALAQSDRELRILSDALLGGEDDELLYEEEMEQLNNDQLRWTYIYLLVRAERHDDASAELKRYLKNKRAEHREEAKALLRKLKT